MSAYPEHSTDYEISQREATLAGEVERQQLEARANGGAMLPNGRQPEEALTGDLSAEASLPPERTSAFKMMALVALARNKGALRKTAIELGIPMGELSKWRSESLKGKGLPEPLKVASTASLTYARRRLGIIVNTIIDDLPNSLMTASLPERVGALSKLVPLMAEIDSINKPPKMSEEVKAMLKKRAQEKLKKKKTDAETESD